MPGPYVATVLKGTQPFSYNGKTYKPEDMTPKLNACQLKVFLAAFSSVNLDLGVDILIKRK